MSTCELVPGDYCTWQTWEPDDDCESEMTFYDSLTEGQAAIEDPDERNLYWERVSSCSHHLPWENLNSNIIPFLWKDKEFKPLLEETIARAHAIGLSEPDKREAAMEEYISALRIVMDKMKDHEYIEADASVVFDMWKLDLVLGAVLEEMEEEDEGGSTSYYQNSLRDAEIYFTGNCRPYYRAEYARPGPRPEPAEEINFGEDNDLPF